MHSTTCLYPLSTCQHDPRARPAKFSPAKQEVLDDHKARVEAGEKRDYPASAAS
jgi:hypothetical protein